MNCHRRFLLITVCDNYISQTIFFTKPPVIVNMFNIDSNLTSNWIFLFHFLYLHMGEQCGQLLLTKYF